MIVNENVVIQEQETGTYVFPVKEIDQPYTWALFIYKDGSAELYTKRNQKTGALLGKPIKLKANPCHHETERIPVGDPRNLYKTDNFVCKKCKKEFRKV